MDTISGDFDTTGRLTVGVPISGDIDFLGDKDWFAITLDAGARYSITMERPNGSALGVFAIEGLLDRTGRNLVFGASNAPPDRVAEVEFVSSVAGDYFIPVRGGTSFSPASVSVGAYTLRIDQLIDTDDHGSDFATATPLMPGIAAQGVLQGDVFQGGDADWFRIELEAGDIALADFEGGGVVVSDGYRDYTSFNFLSSDLAFDPATNTFRDWSGLLADRDGTYSYAVTGAPAPYGLQVDVVQPFDDDTIAAIARGEGPTVYPAPPPWSTPLSFSPDWVRVPDAGHIVEHAEVTVGGRSADILVGSRRGDVILGDYGASELALRKAFYADLIYQQLLGRSMEDAAIAQRDPQFNDGTPIERWVTDFAAEILASPEAGQRLGAVDVTTDQGREAFVETMYSALGSAPSQEESATWSYLLRFSSPEAVATRFALSDQAWGLRVDDAAGRLIQSAPEDGFATLLTLFEALLGRDASAAELALYGTPLASGGDLAQVAASILNSQEYAAINTHLALPELLADQAVAEGLVTLGDGQTRADLVDRITAEVAADAPGAVVTYLASPDAAQTIATMRAQADGDWLIGRDGDDWLFGGFGADTFSFAPDEGFNRVLDFEAWDYLDLSRFGFDSKADALSHFSSVNTEAVFNHEGTAIVLYTTDLASITEETILI